MLIHMDYCDMWHSLDGIGLSSAALSMLPWPRPAVWPAVPPDVSRVLAKEQVLLQDTLLLL